jgi:hypothetical protein
MFSLVFAGAQRHCALAGMHKTRHAKSPNLSLVPMLPAAYFILAESRPLIRRLRAACARHESNKLRINNGEAKAGQARDR